MKTLRLLSISDICEMLAANQSANSKLFISGNLGMAIGINKVFDKLVAIEEPIVVEEPRFILVTKGSCSITPICR